MDCRQLASCLVIAAAAALSASGAHGQQAAGRFVHPGTVLDDKGMSPVVASVKAWPRSEQTGEDGDCVVYGDAPLDSQTSDGSGNFGLAIDAAQRTYTVTYCATAYHTRVDRDLPNSTDGSPVVPTPVRLWPVAAPTSGSPDYSDAVVRRAVFALNELAYLRSVSPDAFQSAMSEYAAIVAESDREQQGGVLSSLSELIAAWSR